MRTVLLTATGARPKAWALCERWMATQTHTGAVTWIIVDDGPTPQPITFARPGWDLQVLRPSPVWAPGQNTQARNLLAGLAHVNPGDALLIVEDDDWYAADWIDHALNELKRCELVGEGRARYYNLATRTGRELGNVHHASLCATAMRGEAIRTFRHACTQQPKFIDLALWRRHGSRKVFHGHRVVGVKGLPGRGGIGMGHNPGFSGHRDASLDLLSTWVGAEAADLYAGVFA